MMSRDEVVKLMESSRTPQEWNLNCRKVKAEFDGHYPPFWYEAILSTGLADRVIKAAGDPHGAAIRISDD